MRWPTGSPRKLKALADRLADIAGLGDQQVADRIRDDRIDILVDLALHTADNRLLVFARKPAPVQVTMLGMPATTGLATIDYRLTDPYLDPPGCSRRRLHRAIDPAPPLLLVLSAAGGGAAGRRIAGAEKNGFVTFGCLNQFAKVSRPALQLWIDILQSLPDSRLVIQSPPGSHRDAVRALFQDGGIAADRVEFVREASPVRVFPPLSRPGPVPRPVPLQRPHQHAGFALDGRAGHHAGGPHGGGPRGGEHPVEPGPARADRRRRPSSTCEIAVRLGRRPGAAFRAPGRVAAADAVVAADGRQSATPRTWKRRFGGCGRPGAADDAISNRGHVSERTKLYATERCLVV